MAFIGTWLVTALACFCAIALVPGITAVGGSYAGPIMCALALALVNASIKPIAQALALPFTVITLGLFAIVVNALLLQLASVLSVSLFVSGIAIDSFMSAVLGSIVISIAYTVFSGIIGV